MSPRQKRSRSGWVLFLALIMTTSFLVSISTAEVTAQTSPIDSCVLTPELLSGQGFSLSGQGFSLSGQSFSLSGQGFSLSGQGFSLAGLGFSLSGQIAAAAEIKDNPVTPGLWLTERLPFFDGAADFNTVTTAILVVDDFGGYAFPTPIGRAQDYSSLSLPATHGTEVIQAVLDSIIAANNVLEPDLDIWIMPIDVSGASVDYETDNLVTLLESAVATLNTQYGVTHFVYNLSFGLIACEDPGDPANGIPPFDFHQTLLEVEAANEPQPPQRVSPTLECVMPNEYGEPYSEEQEYEQFYTAYFGYLNENDESVSIAIGSENKITGTDGWDQGQPRVFEAGRQRNAFSVTFSGDEVLVWTLEGPDGRRRTATASANSAQCNPAPLEPTFSVTPVLECVAENPAGGYTARFGYINSDSEYRLASAIPVGEGNSFSPSPVDRGQTTIFLPGTHSNVFSVDFSESVTWTLGEHSVFASSEASPCETRNGIGLADQLVAQGLPEDLVDERIAELTSAVTNDPNLGPFRTFLQQKLALSGNPTQPEQHVAVASAGNYRPWLGGNPLAPAAWPETIAVGATLNDTNIAWSFSQDGTVLAPGAGYPLFAISGANSYGAGTSFAAPIFSTLVGTCATMPFGLYFDGVNPPVSTNAFTNNVIGLDDFTPLLCSVNRAPEINDQSFETDEGVALEFTLVATDSDGDALTYSVGSPAHGTLSGTAPNLTYTPNPGFSGADQFSVEVCDPFGVCDTATVTITVNAVNPPPPTTCDGLEATIYVQDGRVVGGRLDGRVYRGVLIGTNFDDVIVGTNADDHVRGGNGNDVICGYGGNDHLNGNNGADTLIGGEGEDTLIGGNGEDTLSGESGDDTLRGDHSSDVLSGGDGDDTLIGGEGEDTIDAGSGNDTVNAGNGQDVIHAGEGDDTVIAGGGDDQVFGGPGEDSLRGGSGQDDLFGEDENDTLFGNSGDDDLDGGDGDDLCHGGANNDTAAACETLRSIER